MNTHTLALQYLLTQGYSIIPVNTKNKKPLLKWQIYEERLPTEEEVALWWAKGNNGLGIVTGKVSNITVIDIDVKDRDVHMSPADFPPTYTVRTRSGGWHLYYNYYPNIKNSADGWKGLPGVDIRNNGGYVIAPPTEGYEVIHNVPLVDFPHHLFTQSKTATGAGKKFSLAHNVGLTKGGRNVAITSVIGSLLHDSAEDRWSTDIWEAVQKINQTYVPPLPLDELRNTFESVASREKTRREESQKLMLGSVRSPIQFDDNEAVEMKLRTTKNGGVIKDKLNALIALSNHPDWHTAFRYDSFKKEIQYKGQSMKDHHVLETQTWLQGEMGMSGIAKAIVADAIEERAHVCAYDSAVSWLETLAWDGVPRVDTWLTSVYGVEDSQYYRSIGSNWLRAVVRRLVYPASKFDYVLVIRGAQGVRKSTSIAALGRDWHVETIIRADDKDFIMQFDGKAIVEFSEGGTLSHSDTKILKAVITRTTDKYRAPYARFVEEHPRRCVFCMTTNEDQFLKDETGNRRWWIVQMPDDTEANVEWIAEFRDQLFAEAYARRDDEWLEVPKEEAEEMQDESRIEDDIYEKVEEWYSQLPPDRREEGVRYRDFFEYMHVGKEDKMPVTIPWGVELKIKSAFIGTLYLKYGQRRRDGKRVKRWWPTSKTAKIEFTRVTIF